MATPEGQSDIENPTPSVFGKIRGLNKSVIIMGLISLFADISSEMLYPITPIFLTQTLGAPIAALGFIEGLAEACASFLKTPVGRWSDRIARRKPFILVGYFLSAISKPATGLATNWIHIMLARSSDRIGKGLRGGPRDALLSDSVSADQQGIAFGWHRSMDTLGAVLGPLFALALIPYFAGNLRSVYSISVIPGLIAVLLILPLRDPQTAKPIKKTEPKLLSWQELHPNFRRYLIAWTVFSIANSSDAFLLLRAKNSGYGLTKVILFYCGYNLVYALASPVLGGLSDQIGRKKVLFAGLFVFAAVYLGFSVSTQEWQFWSLFALYGLYAAATDGVGKALAVDLIPKDQKAYGLGLLGTFTGISTLVASTAAGLLWDHVSPVAPFVYGATGAVAAACIVLSLPKIDQSTKI